MIKAIITVFVATVATFLINTSATTASASSNDEIMFILDASSSMLINDNTSKTRIERAKEAMISTIKALPSDQRIGVRVYGSKVPDTNEVEGCKDSVSLSSPKANNASALTRQINDVQAKGWTPISKALEDVQGDFKGEGQKTVILLSDGVDTCAPEKVCKTAETIKADGTDVKVNVLGLVVSREARSQLQCIAKNSGGSYYDVNNLYRLKKGLAALTQKSIILFDGKGIPVEGTKDVLESPALIENTLYKDTLEADEKVFYSFDALPKQKVTFTVRAADAKDELSAFNYLGLRAYAKLDGSKLSASGIFGDSERFNRGPDVVTTTYTIDTEKQGITKPQPVAFEVSIRSNEANIPLELKVTTEGGEVPNNVTKETTSADSTGKQKDDNTNWLIIALAAVFGLAIVGALGYFTARYLKKNRQ